MFLIIYLVFQFFWINSHCQSLPSIELRKCCKDNEVLDSSNKYQCVPRELDQDQELTVNVSSFADDGQTSSSHSLNLKFAENISLSCNQYHQIYFKFTIWKFGVPNEENIYLNNVYNNEPESYNPEDCCVDFARNDQNSEEVLIAQQCLQCPEDKPCVNFCCAENEVNIVNGTISMCKESNKTEDVTKIYTQSDNYTYVHTDFQCDGGETYLWPRYHWKFTPNGTIINGDPFELNNYCIEQTANMAMTCRNNSPSDYIRSTAKLIVMSISIVCIVIIIICNCASDELRNNHVTAIKIPFFFFLALSFLIVVVRNKHHASLVTNTSGCIITGLLLQFSALSIFFWLTCLSVDVYLRFRKIHDFRATEVSRNHLYYSVSILGPAIITIVTMILQFAADQDEAGYIHPSIGKTCELGKYLPLFLYFHLIIIILLGINCLLFLAMIHVLTKGPWNLCGSNGCAQTSMSCMKTYRIFLELFFIMGVNWIAESASFFVDWVYPGTPEHPILILLEIINWSIGLIMFVFFICKASNRALVAEMLPSSLVDEDAVTLRTYSSQISSDSASAMMTQDTKRINHFK